MFDRKCVFFLLAFFHIILGLAGCAETTSDSNWFGEAELASVDFKNQRAERFHPLWIPRVGQSNYFGIHFEGESPEVVTWGPKNFTIDQDGTFWIADTVVEHILHVDRRGTVIDIIDTSEDAVGATMAQSNGQELAVVSVASQPPRALRYSLEGELLNTYDLPMEWQGSVTGISLSDDGTIAVQREHGYRFHPIIEAKDGTYEVTEVAGITWDLNEPSKFDRFTINPVDDRNTISLRRFMGEWDGLTYIYAEEWRDDEYGRAVVDSTVHLFNKEAEEIGIARVDIRGRYTFVDLGGIQYDEKSGQVLAMMTKKNGLGITALKFVDHLEPLEDWGVPDDFEDTDNDSIPTMSATCVSGSTMISVASSMANTTWSLPSGSYSPIITDTCCTSRTIPRYLPSSGVGPYYNGVPYSWGDWDNSTLFAGYMRTATTSNCYKAGDAWTSSDTSLTSPASCGRGTDCSGLVSRAWGLSSKIGTSAIASTTYTALDTGSWDQGEVYVKSGTHVVIYYGVSSGTNYYWYEATVDSNYDRTLRTTQPTSYWGSGYYHRRYVSQC